MKNKTFTFNTDHWLGNKSLRSCSTAARGLWIDILALCCEDGYLTINGKAIDDIALARLVGETPSKVVKLMKELGSSGIFHVTEDGKLYSPSIISQIKKSQTPIVKQKPSEFEEEKKYIDTIYSKSANDVDPKSVVSSSIEKIKGQTDSGDRLVTAHNDSPKYKADWWKTPAGWAKKGREQAICIEQNENIEDFKLRVSLKLGDGLHVEALNDRNKKRFDAQIKKEKDMLSQVTKR